MAESQWAGLGVTADTHGYFMKQGHSWKIQCVLISWVAIAQQHVSYGVMKPDQDASIFTTNRRTTNMNGVHSFEYVLYRFTLTVTCNVYSVCVLQVTNTLSVKWKVVFMKAWMSTVKAVSFGIYDWINIPAVMCIHLLPSYYTSNKLFFFCQTSTPLSFDLSEIVICVSLSVNIQIVV